MTLRDRWRPVGPPNRYDDPDSVALLGQLDHRLLSSLLIAREAERSGATIEWLATDAFIASIHDRDLLFRGNRCTESVPATKVVRSKALVKRLLTEASVRTPAGGAAHSLAQASRLFDQLGAPVVVKPAKGDRGKDITVGVGTVEELEQAYRRAASPAGVVVEEFVAGVEFRCMATGEVCIGVVGRDAPNVVGDGTHTIEALIAQRNQQRAQNPSLRSRPIVIDDHLTSFLARSGRSLQTVPDQASKVYLGGAANLTIGGDSVDYADQVPEVVKETATAAVRAVPGLDWAGVDIILRTTPAATSEFEAFVLEINVNAGISGFHYPVYGAPRNLARELWRRRLAAAEPVGRNGRPAEARWPTGSRLRRAEAGSPADPPTRPGTGSLGALLAEWLTAAGRPVERLAPRLIRVRDGTGVPHLLYDCVGAHDRAVATQVLTRRTTLRRILRRRGVRVAAGQLARTVDDLREFLAKEAGPIRLVPARGEADLVLAELSPPADRRALAAAWRAASVAGPVYLQARPAGARFTMFATRAEALAVFATSADTSCGAAPDARVMTRLRRIAVAAVQAVPELRWAAVELVAPDTAGSPEPDVRRIAVERMTIYPTIRAGDRLLAGGLDAFFAAIHPDLLGDAPPARRWSGWRAWLPGRALR